MTKINGKTVTHYRLKIGRRGVQVQALGTGAKGGRYTLDIVKRSDGNVAEAMTTILNAADSAEKPK